MLEDREIVIGVCGGIAAYKTAGLVSQLVQAGAGVSVVMTESAHAFIGPATFAALTGRPVATQNFDVNHPLGPHISIIDGADLLCIAPTTANFMAKAAHGIADDLLSTIYLTRTCPALFAPAMNCEMWEKPSVARNLEQLLRDGVTMVGPEEGWLSCRKKGIGRMSAPETIFEAIRAALAR